MTKTETPQSQATEAAGARPKILKSFLALGPGFVYALTVLGTGDLISNSAAGAGYGYALIWALGLTLVFRFVWVNTSAKYVLVTGESLIKGYARLGNWVVWVVLIAIIFLRHFYNLSSDRKRLSCQVGSYPRAPPRGGVLSFPWQSAVRVRASADRFRAFDQSIDFVQRQILARAIVRILSTGFALAY